ncbi:MAG: ribosomal-processing cysteine protease Prp [Lachnospiraceae bacterium]
MIHVTIYQNNKNECVGFLTDGHAGYSEEGTDVVCAAASVLIINTMNAIELYAHDTCSLVTNEETGMIAYHIVSGHPSEDANLLLRTMILGLEEMADDENYAEYIDLTFEEV